MEQHHASRAGLSGAAAVGGSDLELDERGEPLRLDPEPGEYARHRCGRWAQDAEQEVLGADPAVAAAQGLAQRPLERVARGEVQTRAVGAGPCRHGGHNRGGHPDDLERGHEVLLDRRGDRVAAQLGLADRARGRIAPPASASSRYSGSTRSAPSDRASA